MSQAASLLLEVASISNSTCMIVEAALSAPGWSSITTAVALCSWDMAIPRVDTNRTGARLCPDTTGSHCTPQLSEDADSNARLDHPDSFDSLIPLGSALGFESELPGAE